MDNFYLVTDAGLRRRAGRNKTRAPHADRCKSGVRCRSLQAAFSYVR